MLLDRPIYELPVSDHPVSASYMQFLAGGALLIRRFTTGASIETGQPSCSQSRPPYAQLRRHIMKIFGRFCKRVSLGLRLAIVVALILAIFVIPGEAQTWNLLAP